MRIISRLNPTEGITDFWSYVRRPQPYRGWILLASVLLTFTTMSWLLAEKEYMPPQPPKVTYISTFQPGRTDAQIEASNLANQAKQDELAAERAARAEKAKEIFRELGRASGMDVDKIEREAAQERARKEAETRARFAPDAGAKTDDGVAQPAG